MFSLFPSVTEQPLSAPCYATDMLQRFENGSSKLTSPVFSTTHEAAWPLPFIDFIRTRCSGLNSSSLSEAEVRCHLDAVSPTRPDDALLYWRNIAFDLFDVVSKLVAASAVQTDGVLPPAIDTTPPEPSTEKHYVFTPHVGSQTTMLTKAHVGEEEDDGSYTINQHVVLMPLGHGTQGEVVLAMDTKKNELRAIKAIPRPKGIHNGPDNVTRGALGAAKAARRQQLEREITIMKHCRHRNIVALHEVIDDPELDVMYLVMQYVEKGPIAKLRDDWTIVEPIDPIKLASYTVQLCAGLSYLHRKGVIHRDIKPDNVLIGAHDDVYLADFGTSDLFRGDESQRVLGHRGTTAFMAPELLQAGTDDFGEAVDGVAVDIWSLGITLYVLLYGKLPWQARRLSDLVEEVVTSPVVFSPRENTLGVALLSQSQDHPGRLSISFVSEPVNASPLPPPYSARGFRRRSVAAPLAAFAPLSECDISSPGSPVSGRRYYASSTCEDHQCEDVATLWSHLLNDMLQKNPNARPRLTAISARAQQILNLAGSDSNANEESCLGHSSSQAIAMRFGA